MDILIPTNWLKSYLVTKATTKDIAKYLALCGPSVERITGESKNPIYAIEVTTNRVDTASVYGIAREASAILPRFKINAKLAPIKLSSKPVFSKKVRYLNVVVDSTLCKRFTAILIKDISIKDSPNWIKERLIAVGERPINNIVDVTNYVMHELGQPLHVFDYQKITNQKMILRESRKGEKIKTLDGKDYVLEGRDIVIEDGSGKLIDLCGIMGGNNSKVDENTKDVLIFVQNYNPSRIRQTSMKLAIRTQAAVLFEKGLDSEMVPTALRKSIDLILETAGGKVESKAIDIYPSPYKTKTVSLSLEFITRRIGIILTKVEITNSLKPLGFEVTWKSNLLEVKIPSYRGLDIEIPEDIVEEIARIYGYHNLPNKMLTGQIPEIWPDSPFDFETKIKNTLKGFGGIETYALSLVPKNFVKSSALKLKNPLGNDSEYLRDTLESSLFSTTLINKGEKEPYHIFEMANVYIPQKNDLPKEEMRLAGIFSNYSYREAKGVLEGTFESLNIKIEKPENNIKLIDRYVYYEFSIEALRKNQKPITFKPIPKFPAQIEDITITAPEKTEVGEMIKKIKETDKFIIKVEFITEFKNSYTFRVWFQDPNKTLANHEVKKIREKILNKLTF